MAGASFPASATTNFNVDPSFELEEQIEWSTTSNWVTSNVFGKIIPHGVYGIPVQVSTGYSFSSILLNTGVVVSFGDNTQFQTGRVGTSTYVPKKPDAATSFLNSFYLESGGVAAYVLSDDLLKKIGYNMTKIATGQNHTVILDNTGKLYAWGHNGQGQLGNGTQTYSSTPVLINTGVNTLANNIIVSIACGNAHTIALDNMGKLYSWGNNVNGQLGNGTTTDSSTPLLINTGAIANKTIVSIACGGSHTIALDNTGTLYSWGNNVNGQLGNGTTTDSSTPLLINTGAILNNTIVRIVSLYAHVLALDNMGKLYAWGWNMNGQLGNGTTTDSSTPLLINTGAIANKTIVNISGGANYTIAIDNTGKLYAWGHNDQGQLGNGTTTNSSTPILINTGAIANKTIVNISGGYYHTTAIDNTGKLYAWGYNGDGQLGNGTTTNSSTPLLINTGAIANNIVVSSACSSYHTIALDNTGKLYTWGGNISGQLGNGTTTNSSIPIFIMLTPEGSPVIFNFTGQHRCLLQQNNTISIDLTGLVVVSNTDKYISNDMKKRYSKLELINDAIPVVSLSSKKADKAVFGVISQGIDLGMRLEDKNEINSMVNYPDKSLQNKGDSRLQINSLGEGCIWVVEDDESKPLESGDLLMTSDTPGYSMLQYDDLMHGYTIAKLTRSCDWNPQKIPVEITKTDIYGNFIPDPVTNQPIFETVTIPESPDPGTKIVTPEHLQTEDEYTIRYINSVDGSISTVEAYDLQEIDPTTLRTIKRAALLGCTYHCG